MQGRASSHRSLSSVDKGVVTVEKSTSVYIDENQDARVLKTVFVTPDRIRHTPAEMSWVARDFRFHTGEVLPELRLHYTTVGDASRPSVLILHGTTGSGSGLLSPSFGGRAVRSRSGAGRKQVLHNSARRHRSRKILQAVRRHAGTISAVQLLRYGRSAIPPDNREPRHSAFAPDTRQLNGRYAYLDLGHHATRLHGCVGALGLATQ